MWMKDANFRPPMMYLPAAIGQEMSDAGVVPEGQDCFSRALSIEAVQVGLGSEHACKTHSPFAVCTFEKPFESKAADNWRKFAKVMRRSLASSPSCIFTCLVRCLPSEAANHFVCTTLPSGWSSWLMARCPVRVLWTYPGSLLLSCSHVKLIGYDNSLQVLTGCCRLPDQPWAQGLLDGLLSEPPNSSPYLCWSVVKLCGTVSRYAAETWSASLGS